MKYTIDDMGLRERIQTWESSLPREVSAEALLARCPVAHKWKVTFLIVLSREATLWRMSDLGRALVRLVDSHDALAARIVLRSACETAALLAYLNKKIESLIEGQISFDDFNTLVRRVALGGKNGGDYFEPVNVMTAIQHFSKEHPLIQEIYDRLSEDAHPNASGLLYAYSDTNPELLETTFHRKIASADATSSHTATSADLIFLSYEQQYNSIWPARFESLEQWLREKDASLVASEHLRSHKE